MISSTIHTGGAAMLTAIIVAFMCLPGILGAWMAKTRGRGMVTWFLLCMVLPLIAHIVLLALPRRYRWTRPACEGGLPNGKVQRCMHCGHIFKRNMPQAPEAAPESCPPLPAEPADASDAQADGVDGDAGDAALVEDKSVLT